MIRNISKYRDALIGVAILWVMLHHSGLDLPNPLFALKRSGYGGVDIFMFLSGFGCVVSLTRNRNALSFYKRRLVRIYPHYIPVLAVFIVLNASWGLECLRDIFGNLTGFSFWAMTGLRFNWYILAIVAFYIATPLFFEVLQNKGKRGLLFLLILSFIASFCFNETEASIAVSRFPVYILGMGAGLRFAAGDKQENRISDKILELIIFSCGIVGLACLAVLYKFQDPIPAELYNVFIPCFLTTPAIVLLFSRFFGFIEKKIIGKGIIKCFSFLGKISLDLYLIHIVSFNKIGVLIEGSYDNASAHSVSIRNIIIWLAIILCCIGVSYCYCRTIDYLYNFCALRKKKVRES